MLVAIRTNMLAVSTITRTTASRVARTSVFFTVSAIHAFFVNQKVSRQYNIKKNIFRNKKISEKDSNFETYSVFLNLTTKKCCEENKRTNNGYIYQKIFKFP